MLDQSFVEITTCLVVALNILMGIYIFLVNKVKKMLTSLPNC